MRQQNLATGCEHIDIPLTSVVSLAACAFAGGGANVSPDPVAESVWERLGADAARLSVLELDAARERAATLDEHARRWAGQHPNGTIVELGAGLSTRHARLADLSVAYVAIDEPPLASLREELFVRPLPYVQVAMALEDRRWSRAVVAASREVLVLVPDAWVDLHPEDVVATAVALSAELPRGTTIIAAYGPKAQLRVARPDARHPSVEVRIDHGFGAVESIAIPRLRWLEVPRPEDGADLPALALLHTA